MKNKTQKSFGKKCLERLLEIATPILAVLSHGCIEGYTVTPELGLNIPTSQRGNLVQYDNAITYGVKGEVRTKKGVEVEVGYRGHNTNWKDAFQENDVEVGDLSVGVVIPFVRKKGTTVYATAKVTSRSEEEESRLIGIPGSELSESRSATGYGLGVGARVQAGKGELDARVSYEGFGEGSYEESGLNASVGYTFSF
jgi:opacity protein-like surface antigen